LYKFKTKARSAVRLENRKPIPLPLLAPHIKGVQADRPHEPPIYETNQVDRVRFTVANVLVRFREDSLLINEYFVSNVKMPTPALAIINNHNAGDV